MGLDMKRNLEELKISHVNYLVLPVTDLSLKAVVQTNFQDKYGMRDYLISFLEITKTSDIKKSVIDHIVKKYYMCDMLNTDWQRLSPKQCYTIV